MNYSQCPPVEGIMQGVVGSTRLEHWHSLSYGIGKLWYNTDNDEVHILQNTQRRSSSS